MKRLSALASVFAAVVLLALAVKMDVINLPPAYDPFAPLDIGADPTFVTRFKLWRIDRAPELCQAALKQAGLSFIPQPDRQQDKGCNLIDTVTITKLLNTRLSPANVQMTCGLAVRLALLEQHGLQDAAWQILKSSVTAITHYGAYACRNINNRKNGRLSQHASANALDIAGFTLADGRKISVAADWRGDSAKSQFLKKVRDNACGFFTAVLGPDYNALHQNHFHVDLGVYGVCR